MKQVWSIFGQILRLTPRDKFEAVVAEHQTERHARIQQAGLVCGPVLLSAGADKIIAADHRRLTGQRRKLKKSGITGSAGGQGSRESDCPQTELQRSRCLCSIADTPITIGSSV